MNLSTKDLLDIYKEFNENRINAKKSLKKLLTEKNENFLYNELIEISEKVSTSFLIFASRFILKLTITNYWYEKDISEELFYDFADACDNCDFVFLEEKPPNEKIKQLAEKVFENYPNNTEVCSIKHFCERDGRDLFINRSKCLLFEFLTKRYAEKVLFHNEENNISVDKVRNYEHLVNFVLKLNDYLHNQEVIKVENAKIQEREKILADLSHRIKNLLHNIYGNLKQLQDGKNQGLVLTTIQATDLITQIVNGFNYAGTGSFDDFIYDAENNSPGDLLSDLLYSCLRKSLENMFLAKFFNEFMRNYFSNKSQFEQAKHALENADWNDLKQLQDICNTYFFNIDIEYDECVKNKIGKQKSSNIKFFIVFYEIIFNAVKYTSYVPFKNRHVNIILKKNGNNITFSLRNTFNNSIKKKTTGLGQYIVQSMCKLMNAQFKQSIVGSYYSIEFNFPDYWDKESI